MKLYIPREHGAWSMWISPFFIAAFLSPWTSLKVLAFIGVLSLYCSSASLLALFRTAKPKESPYPSLLLFFLSGVAFLSVPIWMYPETLLYGLVVIPFFLLNIYFAKKKSERLFLNDVIAIAALSSISMFVVHLGFGHFDWIGVKIWGICIAYFTGTVFYVKSLIRERGNTRFRRTSYLYHLILVLIPFLLGYWWISLIFLPFLLKVIGTPAHLKPRAMTIGIAEIFFSILFVVLTTLLL